MAENEEIEKNKGCACNPGPKPYEPPRRMPPPPKDGEVPPDDKPHPRPPWVDNGHHSYQQATVRPNYHWRPGPPNNCCDVDFFMRDREIQNVTQLISYIKGQLGSPVICVELADTQLYDMIGRAHV